MPTSTSPIAMDEAIVGKGICNGGGRTIGSPARRNLITGGSMLQPRGSPSPAPGPPQDARGCPPPASGSLASVSVLLSSKRERWLQGGLCWGVCFGGILAFWVPHPCLHTPPAPSTPCKISIVPGLIVGLSLKWGPWGSVNGLRRGGLEGGVWGTLPGASAYHPLPGGN